MNYIERKNVAEQKGLKPGLFFTLTTDVIPPKVDRRCKDDWRKHANIKAGMKFVVLETWVGRDQSILVLERANHKFASLYQVPITDELFALLVPHLEPSAESLQDVLNQAYEHHSVSAEDVVNYFVEGGMLSVDDVKAAVAATVNQWNAEQEAVDAAKAAEVASKVVEATPEAAPVAATESAKPSNGMLSTVAPTSAPTDLQV